MKKSLLILVALLTVAGSAMAQTVVEERSKTKVGEFMNPKREFNYGFVSVGGGALLYMGDYASERELGDRLSSPIIDAAIGKMFNPYLGARIQWSGWNASAATVAGTKFQGGQLRDAPGYYKNDFYLNYAHVDLLWNLSNSLGGAKESRTWDFVPYVGLGWVNASKDGVDPSNRLGVNLGLLQQFRLSPSVDLLLDVRAMGTNKNLDGAVKDDGSAFDMGLSASLGVAYNIGRARNKVVFEEVDLSVYDNRVNAIQRDLDAMRASRDQLARELEAEKAKDKTVITQNIVMPQLAVWFSINKSNLTEQEKINLGYIADAIKKGDSNKVYTIYGSADKQTGSPVVNQRLSEQRAQAVYDELVKNGVSASQLRLNPVGDTQAKFDKPLLNRVAIVEN